MRRLVLLSIAVLALLYGGVLAGAAIWARADVPHENCPSEDAVVQVDTRTRVLSLCRAGHEDGHFRVALGRNGVDKRRDGDGRTPRGRYPLSPARASARYHLFLPVGYPTKDQLKYGYTGSAIGVHGPHKAFAWLGHATVWPDWTLGCIALGTRAEVRHVSRWVRQNAVGEILIL